MNFAPVRRPLVLLSALCLALSAVAAPQEKIPAAGDSKSKSKTKAPPKTESKSEPKVEPKREAAPPAGGDSVNDILQGFAKGVVMLVRDFDRGAGNPDGIFLPLETYKQLRKDAERGRVPARAGFTKVEVTGELGENVAQLVVRLEARVDDEGGADLDLRLQEAQCEKFEVRYRVDPGAVGAPVAIDLPLRKAGPRDPFILSTDRKGQYLCELTLSVAIDRGPIDRRLALALPAAPVKFVRLREQSVRRGMRVELARQGRLEKNVPLEDASTLAPRLGQDDSLELSWRLSRDAVGAAGAQLQSNVVYRAELRGGNLEVVADFNVSGRKEVRDLVFRIPAGAQLQSFSLEGFPVQPEQIAEAGPKGASRIRATIGELAAAGAPVRIEIVKPLPANAGETALIDLPLPVLEGAAQSGRLLILGGESESLRLSPGQISDRDATRLADGRLEPDLQALSPTLALQLAAAPATLPFRVERIRPVFAQTAGKVDVRVEEKQIEFTADAALSIRQGFVETVRWSVPAGATDLECVPAALVKSVELGKPDPKTGRALCTVQLRERRTQDLSLQLRGRLPAAVNLDASLAIPVLVQEGLDFPTSVAIRKPGNLELTFLPAGTGELQPVAAESDAGQRPWLVFRTTGKNPRLGLKTRVLHRQTTAVAEHRLRRLGDGVQVVTVLRWESRFDPLREVRLVVPPALAEVRVTGDLLALPAGGAILGPGLKDLPLSIPGEACEARIEYVLPADASTDRRVVPLCTPQADRVTKTVVAIVGEADWAPAASDGWTPTASEIGADPDAGTEAPVLLAASSDRARDAVALERPTGAGLARTLIARAVVKEAIAANGRRRGLLAALATRNRAETIALRIPSECTVLEVFLDGKPVSIPPLIAGQMALRAPTDDRPFTIEVRYESRTAAPGLLQRLALAPPRFDGEVAVQQALWEIVAGRDVLFAPWDAATVAESRWRWRWGMLRPAVAAPVAAASASDWLREADPAASWSAPEPDPENGRRTLLLSTSPSLEIKVLAVRESYWALVLSSVVLVAGALARQFSRRRQARIFAGAAIFGAAACVLAPDFAGWSWLGAQWGALLLVAGFAAPRLRGWWDEFRWRLRRRRTGVVLSAPARTATPTLAA
ncbi:MAG TPA: hypothetical protein VNC50_18395, partial [Planctomycetia bacterium]|nr:hypothetical protein [Planctomycetia bacterium]